MTNLMPVVLWSQDSCGPCYAAATALKLAGVPFVKMDISLADSARIARWYGKGWGTPIIQAGALEFQGVDRDRIAALAQS